MRTKRRTPNCRRCLILSSLARAHVPPETVDVVCERMWLNRVPSRQTLYFEGNRASHSYAIRSGQVKLARIDASGREHVVGLLGPGDLFGIEALFEEEYASNAQALADSELCLLPSSLLQGLLRARPALAFDFARYLHRQLLQAREQAVTRSATGAKAKLAAYFLDAAGRQSPETPVLRNALTLRELGAALGLCAETVCRALRSLREEGLLEMRRGEVRILDPHALRVLAGN